MGAGELTASLQLYRLRVKAVVRRGLSTPKPTSTGRGIGAGLVKMAKRERPQGLQLWTFASNSGAQRFYERHGFVETGRTDGDNEEGAPDILYVWRGESVAG